MIIIPFSPNNCHLILVVVSIKERNIVVTSPLIKNTVWADASVRKGVDVGLEIIRLKFNVQDEDMTKINTTHVKQSTLRNIGGTYLKRFLVNVFQTSAATTSKANIKIARY